MLSKKEAMAYAVGYVTVDGSCTDMKRIDLGKVMEDWRDYKLVGFGSDNRNRTYMLNYKGSFGKSLIDSKLISTEDAWELNHIVAILIMAIECHQAEVKNAK